jgi:hypothetical protein
MNIERLSDGSDYHVRLPPTLSRVVAEQAKANGRSESAEIRFALTRYYASQERTK